MKNRMFKESSFLALITNPLCSVGRILKTILINIALSNKLVSDLRNFDTFLCVLPVSSTNKTAHQMQSIFSLER
jgi:hypothetical protein